MSEPLTDEGEVKAEFVHGVDESGELTNNLRRVGERPCPFDGIQSEDRAVGESRPAQLLRRRTWAIRTSI